MRNSIIGCIDGSSSTTAVCQYSAWVANKLMAPLNLLHVIERKDHSITNDLSGSIGFDSREQLLDELVKIEGERARIMKEQGKQLLQAAENIAKKLGVNEINTIQRHGALSEILGEIQDVRIMILGRRGEQSEGSGHIGSQLESIIRLQKSPVLVSTGDYTHPSKVMVAYDGSDEGKKALENLAISQLLQGLECYLVMNGDNSQSLKDAQNILENAGIKSQANLIAGSNIPESLCQYAFENNINLMVMGAYGHSRLRQFIIGSNTTAMLSKTTIPLLMLR